MIDVEGLTKVYLRSRKDGAKALDGVSFDVPDQSIFGFLGANGAGKTTTIRILATILPPMAGTASVGGHEILSDPLAFKASIDGMPECPGCNPKMTPEQRRPTGAVLPPGLRTNASSGRTSSAASSASTTSRRRRSRFAATACSRTSASPRGYPTTH